MLIDETEREDLERAIKDEGYEVSDFSVSEEAKDLPRGKIGLVTGIVKIERISTGIVRTYHGGHGSSWPAEFHRELKGGLFD